MKRRIKRVDKSYWGIVAIWLLATMGRPVDWLTALTGAVVCGYLIWKMAGNET